MKNYLKSRDGAVAVIVAVSLVVLLGFAAFATDAGWIYKRVHEVQNAADAAALAGAALLIGDDLDLVRQEIIDYGQRNFIVTNNPGVPIMIGDITFWNDYWPDTIDPNQVEVTARRTSQRGNPVPFFLARIFGLQTKDVERTARAEVYHPAGSRCVKPFTVPFPFTWDDLDGDGELDVSPDNGEVDTVQMYPSLADGGIVSGTEIVLKVGDPNQTIAPGQYNPVDLPPVGKGTPETGGDAYRENIAECDDSIVEPGDQLQLEPGNMVGPTHQGLDDLIALDSTAQWDGSKGAVWSPDIGDGCWNCSPRLVVIAFYDPTNPPTPGRSTVYVQELGGFFIQGMQGQDVIGVYVGAMAVDPGPGQGSDDSLLYAVRLIRDCTRGAPNCP